MIPLDVPVLAGWLEQEQFDEAFEAACVAVKADKKLKWSLQETRRAPLAFRTKEEAKSVMSARKAELEEAGLTVIGSVQRGAMMYGDGESFVGGITIFGRKKNPPNGG